MKQSPLRVARCIAEMVASNRITDRQADAALTRLEADVKANAALGIPEAQAVVKSAEAMREEAKDWTRLVARRIAAFADLKARADAHPKGFATGALSRFVRDLSMRDADNVASRGEAVAHQAFALMVDFVEAYKSRAIGLVRDVEGPLRVVDEIYGVASADPAAQAAAQGWTRANKFLVERFNAAGGAIKPRTRYLPQEWDGAKVRAEIAARGVGGVADWMMEQRASGNLLIADWKTGKPVDDARAAEIVRNAIPRIASDGLSDLTPGAALREPTAFRHRAHLVFEWTNADAWKAWNEKFGVGTAGLFEAFIAHPRKLAREIGAMEILGPDPAWAARALIDTGRRDGRLTEREAMRIQRAWEVASGIAATPENEMIANIGSSIRSWQAASKLLSATLSTPTDFGYSFLTAQMNGYSAARVMLDYTRMVMGLGRAERLKLAARSGIIAETALRVGHAGLRENIDESVRGWAGRMADTLIRASGLSAHTDFLRVANGLNLMAHLADFRAQPFAKLPKAERGQLARYGIDARAWDAIRDTALDDAGPLPVLSPAEMIRKGGDTEAATRFLEYVRTEIGTYAVPTPGSAEHALVHWARGGTRPGALGHEAASMGLQFKSFGLTVITGNLMRGFQQLRAGDRGLFLVEMAIATTILGALSIQMKAIANGKDPRNAWGPDGPDANFWTSAWFQGGGLGIMTDFVYSAAERGGWRAMGAMLGGPFGETLAQLGDLAFGNTREAIQGKDTHIGRELARILKANTPGSSLFYTRLAVDRLMWDRLQMGIDPDYAGAFRRMEERTYKDSGQRFFWRPGEARPDRPPDFGAITRGRP